MAQNLRQRVGRWGESAAADYLVKQGYLIVARNARTPYGEIDLVCQQGSTLVFVEVKMRNSLKYGYPDQAITAKKLEHMVSAAQHYIDTRAEETQEWRIDVISIWRNEGAPAHDICIEHFENITG